MTQSANAFSIELSTVMTQLLVIGISLLLLASCSNQSVKLKTRKAMPADFSGSWEMDYSLNDSIEAKLEAYFYRMRKQLERQSRSQIEIRREAAPTHHSAQTVLAMAQFVDRISRIQVMDIEHTITDIRIEREETFALNCHFATAGVKTTDNPFATEVCGWDGHQLIFQLRLPEGLVVEQRLTLSADGQRMLVATTMHSDQAPEPFTLNRSYAKFQKRHRGYECKQTVRKGKVCRLTPAPGDTPEAPHPILMNAD